mmetsp:Transcript_39255/g.123797  ORF Transcript_39255/g.123797 Transcript_39255/m.123797 type:complete len:226 (-) Transcript_39255:72-749(-)
MRAARAPPAPAPPLSHFLSRNVEGPAAAAAPGHIWADDPKRLEKVLTMPAMPDSTSVPTTPAPCASPAAAERGCTSRSRQRPSSCSVARVTRVRAVSEAYPTLVSVEQSSAACLSSATARSPLTCRGTVAPPSGLCAPEPGDSGSSYRRSDSSSSCSAIRMSRSASRSSTRSCSRDTIVPRSLSGPRSIFMRARGRCTMYFAMAASLSARRDSSSASHAADVGDE